MSCFSDYESMVILDLPDDERVRLKERFEEIAGGFAALDAIDTDGVEPLVSVLSLCNVMREDVASKVISRDDLLANAPEQSEGDLSAFTQPNGYFSVPAAID